MTKSKADLEREVRRLRNKPGWDPRKLARQDPLDKLAQINQELRSERTYDDADACEACAAARAEQGDETALCDEHLAAAMGF